MNYSGRQIKVVKMIETKIEIDGLNKSGYEGTDISFEKIKL